MISLRTCGRVEGRVGRVEWLEGVKELAEGVELKEGPKSSTKAVKVKRNFTRRLSHTINPS